MYCVQMLGHQSTINKKLGPTYCIEYTTVAMEGNLSGIIDISVPLMPQMPVWPLRSGFSVILSHRWRESAKRSPTRKLSIIPTVWLMPWLYPQCCTIPGGNGLKRNRLRRRPLRLMMSLRKLTPRWDWFFCTNYSLLRPNQM